MRVETEKLTRSWAAHEANWLGSYLVTGVEDPRINLQSILSRHFLVRSLAGAGYEALMRQEYRFAAVMEWLLAAAGRPGDSESRSAILHALRRDADNAEGLEIPAYVRQSFAGLPAQVGESHVSNYLEEFLGGGPSGPAGAELAETILDTFSRLWQAALWNRFPQPPHDGGNCPGQNRASVSLLEPACGSANDFRFLHRYGLARLVEYTGFDLCSANIENARGLFPGVRFETGNVFDISAPAKAFDFCIVHDLFEHLSLCGLERAVQEVCRVTRQGICLGFFQMDEIPQHLVRPRDDYYWNLLSLPRVRELFAAQGFHGQAIHIGTFLAHQTGCPQTHNPNAYTLVLEATVGSGPASRPRLDERADTRYAH